MALGRVVDIKWIHEGKLYTGSFCTMQGKSDCPNPLAESLINLSQELWNSLGRQDLHWPLLCVYKGTSKSVPN